MIVGKGRHSRIIDVMHDIWNLRSHSEHQPLIESHAEQPVSSRSLLWIHTSNKNYVNWPMSSEITGYAQHSQRGCGCTSSLPILDLPMITTIVYLTCV